MAGHEKTFFFSRNLNFKAAYTICRSRFGFYIFTPSAVRCHLQRPSSPSLLNATPTSPSPAPFVPSSLLSLSCSTHHCRRAHRGCDISAALPPPRSPLLSPLFSFLRAFGCVVRVKRWVCACMCVRVINEEKLEGRGGLCQRWWLHISCTWAPPLGAIAKATQSISKIHINVLKGQPQPAWSAPAEWFPRHALQSHQPSFSEKQSLH